MAGNDHRYSFGTDFSFKESDKPWQRVLRFALTVAVTGLVVTVVLYLIFALLVNTELEGRLKRENKMYEKLYPVLVEQQKLLEGGISGIQYKDAEVYREVFQSEVPAADPINSLSFLGGNDTIPETRILAYTADKAALIGAGIPAVEDVFQKAILKLASPSTVLPPMDLPVRDISFSQIGASTGPRYNPFLKAYVEHSGLDFILSQGSPVYATADGRVSSVEKSNKGNGNSITITHKGGYVTRYCHLSTMNVRQGAQVRRGQKIAEVGMSGTSFAPHLHYEVLFGGKHLDPMGYIFASVSPQEYTNMLYVATNTRQSMD